MGEENEWMTVQEAAEWSGYNAEHLRALIRAGRIEAVKKGTMWWVSRVSVERYLREGQDSDDERRGPK